MARDCHAGICGSRRVRFPPATRHEESSCQFSNWMSSSQFQCHRDVINDTKVRIGGWRGGGEDLKLRVQFSIEMSTRCPFGHQYETSRGTVMDANMVHVDGSAQKRLAGEPRRHSG